MEVRISLLATAHAVTRTNLNNTDNRHLWNICPVIYKGHGYILEIIQIPGDNTTFIGSSWTRGLAIHPVGMQEFRVSLWSVTTDGTCFVRAATVATVIALALSLSSNLAVELAASITSLVVAFLTILAFIVDIALFGHTKHEFNQLIGWRTSTGPGTLTVPPL